MTDSTQHPDTTLGWGRGHLFGRRAYQLQGEDVIVQREDDGWAIYLETDEYGPEYFDTVDSWTDVLAEVNAGILIVRLIEDDD